MYSPHPAGSKAAMRQALQSVRDYFDFGDAWLADGHDHWPWPLLDTVKEVQHALGLPVTGLVNRREMVPHDYECGPLCVEHGDGRDTSALAVIDAEIERRLDGFVLSEEATK